MTDFNREISNKKKAEIQHIAEELSLQHRHLLLQWATGCGKGLAVLRCILASKSEKKWLIVCPEVLQVENWNKEIEKYGLSEKLKDKLEGIICYASLVNFKNRDLNLALNEAQKVSDLREDIISTIKFDQIVSDGAKIPDVVKSRLFDIYPYLEYDISLKKAISEGILPEPSIYLIPIEVDDKIKRNSVPKKAFQLTDRQYSDKLDKDIKYWQTRYAQTGEEWNIGKMVALGSIRKKFLASLKTEATKKLINQIYGKRFICFTGSIEQADELGGNHAIHSKKGKKHNLTTLKAFNSLEINDIYVNNMGREGLNLEDIEAGIVVQLDSGEDDGNSFIQKTGRSMRADSPELYILYCKSTADERYLKKALQHIDNKYIKDYDKNTAY